MATVDDMPMRWVWIDRIVDFKPGQSCRAVKAVSLAELLPFYDARDGEATRDEKASPAAPLIFPQSLIIEAMAQTSGILVGQARQFAENVILAKISKATFQGVAPAGYCLIFETGIERLDDVGATTSGRVLLHDPATGHDQPLAEIDLLFSHADNLRTGLNLPDTNFVFDGPLLQMLAQLGDETIAKCRPAD